MLFKISLPKKNVKEFVFHSMRQQIGSVTKKHFHFHKTSLVGFYSSKKEPFMFFVEL